MRTEAAVIEPGVLIPAVEDAMTRNQVPGVMVGMCHGQTEDLFPFGITNADYPAPVVPETLFQVGSNTKTVTATTVMRLVEDGKIDLDATVRTYLPDFQVADEDAAARVTIRHLLTHTAGWEGDFWENTGRGDDALARMVDLLGDRPQLTPIGTVWAYNNAAFYVLGRIVEVVSGKTYEAAARELVLEPIGMTRSTYFPEEAMTYPFAAGHRLEGDRLVVERPWQWPRGGGPVGRLVSNAPDMLRYARFHMGDGTTEQGERLLSPGTMRLMQTPYRSAGEGRSIGLAWFLQDLGGARVVSHGGSTAGQVSTFLFVPEQEFALVVLTNSNGGGALGNEIGDLILKQSLGLEQPDRTPIDASPEVLAPYAGRYLGTFGYLDVSVENRALVARNTPTKPLLGRLPPATPPFRMEPVAEDLLQVPDGPLKGTLVELLRDDSGDLAWMRLGGRIWRKEPS